MHPELAGALACLGSDPQPATSAVVDPLADGRPGFIARGMSLETAVAALPLGGARLLLLRGGVYRLRRPLLLGAAAQGGGLVACPGETPVLEGAFGAPTVVIEGARDVRLAGLTFTGPAAIHLLLDGARNCDVERNVFLGGAAGIRLDHAAGNRIAHNTIVQVGTTGIELKDGSDANLIADNLVDGADAPETSGGGIFMHGVRDNRIAHNLIQNTAGFGIGVSNWDEATVNFGNVVEFNRLRRTAQTAIDSGAIYVLGRSGADTEMVVADNVVEEVGAPSRHTVGIYLDDSTSGAVVTRNLVRAVGSDALQIHGGRDNLIENNLLDLGEGQPSAVLFQAAPADTNPLNLQTGNAVMRNVIVSSNLNPRLFVWYDGGRPTIAGNFYALAAGRLPPPGAPVADVDPLLVDPAVSRSDTAGYAALQTAAEALGFRRLDLDAAGIRPATPR